MNKILFKKLFDECSSFNNVGIVLNTIRSCGGYSSAQSVIVTTKDGIEIFDDYIKVEIYKQRIFSCTDMRGTFCIPYEEIKMLVDDYALMEK